DFDRRTLVHRPVAVGNLVEADDPVEDPTGRDSALEDVGEKFVDIRTDWGRAPTDGDVTVESRLPGRGSLVVGHADPSDGTTRADDADRRAEGFVAADAFENGAGAEAACQLPHALRRLVAALPHHVGRAELFRQRDTVWTAAQDDDFLGAQGPGGDEGAQAGESER